MPVYAYAEAANSRGNSPIGQNLGSLPSGIEIPGWNFHQVSGRLLDWGYYEKECPTLEDAKAALSELYNSSFLPLTRQRSKSNYCSKRYFGLFTQPGGFDACETTNTFAA